MWLVRTYAKPLGKWYNGSAMKVNNEAFNRLREDIDDLKAWQRTHDERHGDDNDRLNIILEMLAKHTQNHHGVVSKAKQAGYTSVLVGLLGALLELLRRFAF